jgi:general secretion pathway protein H
MPISAIGTARFPPPDFRGRGTARRAVEGACAGLVLPLHHAASRRGPPPLQMQGRNGFTLVELLVVLFIIALMSAAVLAALPDSGALTAEAERFAARASAARERAVMDNRPIAIRVDQAGYAFDWRQSGEWRQIEARPFAPHRWNEGTRVEASEGRILFDSTGFAEPARLTLSRGRDRVSVEISKGGDVHVRP